MMLPRSTRPGARALVAGLLAVFAGAATLALAPTAFACSCQEIPFATEYAGTDAVFLGLSLGQRSAAPEYPDHHYELFQVHAIWKGTLDPGVEVLVADSDGLCGMTLTAGVDYLVFARLGAPAEPLRTHSCSRTRPFRSDDPIYELLGPPKTTPALPATWGAVKATYR